MHTWSAAVNMSKVFGQKASAPREAYVCGACHPIHNTNHKGITLVTVSEGRNMGPYIDY